MLLAAEGSIPPAVWAFAGVAVAAGASWLVARRNTSGSITTSAAADLWTESQAMRRELREEVVSLRSENRDLRERVSVLEAKVRELGGG